MTVLRISLGLFAVAFASLASAPAVAHSAGQGEHEVAHVPAQVEVGAASGAWSVDLRLALDDPPYDQPMALTVSEDGKVEGTFYGSPIESGRAGAAKGRVCLSFRTSDDSGPYFHAACLKGAQMIGQSWSTGRGFLLPWTATRTAEKD